MGSPCLLLLNFAGEEVGHDPEEALSTKEERMWDPNRPGKEGADELSSEAMPGLAEPSEGNAVVSSTTHVWTEISPALNKSDDEDTHHGFHGPAELSPSREQGGGAATGTGSSDPRDAHETSSGAEDPEGIREGSSQSTSEIVAEKKDGALEELAHNTSFKGSLEAVVPHQPEDLEDHGNSSTTDIPTVTWMTEQSRIPSTLQTGIATTPFSGHPGDSADAEFSSTVPSGTVTPEEMTEGWRTSLPEPLGSMTAGLSEESEDHSGSAWFSSAITTPSSEEATVNFNLGHPSDGYFPWEEHEADETTKLPDQSIVDPTVNVLTEDMEAVSVVADTFPTGGSERHDGLETDATSPAEGISEDVSGPAYLDTPFTEPSLTTAHPLPILPTERSSFGAGGNISGNLFNCTALVLLAVILADRSP